MALRAAALSAFLLLGCFPPGEGLEPPSGNVYFPVGLALDQERRFLFVVNSDFDLQYNAGTVQSWDLAQLRRRVPRGCESDADCACPTDGDGNPDPGCDEAKTICDLYKEEDAPDAEHTIRNAGVPSRWCVAPSSSPCAAFGQQDNRDQALYPGRCGYIDQMRPQDGGEPILPTKRSGIVVDGRFVRIGAFATDVVRRTLVLPPGATVSGYDPDVDPPLQRLFIPVRGDATLHWIDVDENGLLECGQSDSEESLCDGNHRSGDLSSEENTRSDGRLAPEPFGLDADENGVSLIVSNQTSGAVSLFTHRRSAGDDSVIEWSKGPRYVFQESGLPRRPIGIANVPIPLAQPSSGREKLPGFLVTFRDAGRVTLVRVYDDAAADPARPYTQRYESEPIQTNSSGIDSRGIGVDAFHRKANEDACLQRFGVTRECARDPGDPSCSAAQDPALQACLTSAAATPLEVFIANRAPSSLVLGRSQPVVSDSVTSDIPVFHKSLPLDVGPSRVYIGNILNAEGQPERRVFTVCFDSRRIAIYDPERDRVEAEIVTGRGPHAMAIDVGPGYAYAYVAHFLDSYVGVVSLDQRYPSMYGAMIATVGLPVPPRASK